MTGEDSPTKRRTLPFLITGLVLIHILVVTLARVLLPHGAQVWLGVAAGIVLFAMPFWLLCLHSQSKLSDPADNVGWWDRP